MLINKLLRHNILYLTFIVLIASLNNVYATEITNNYPNNIPTTSTLNTYNNNNDKDNNNTHTTSYTIAPQTPALQQINSTDTITQPNNIPAEQMPAKDLNGQTNYTEINKKPNIINSKQINPTSILSKDERREYIRLNSWELAKPIQITINNDNRNKLINISRGGLAFKHNNTIKTGSIIPITIKYRTLNIKTYAQIISSNSNRANCKFINPNKLTANQLLYLSVLLEADNNILITRFN